MNSHTKFIVSALFIMLILLAAGITRFYSDAPVKKSSSSETVVIARKMGSDKAGNRIFRSADGLCGIVDSSDRVIVNPEWDSLSFAGNDMCIARTVIDGSELTGCIDYEGNITIPFIYKSITRHEEEGFLFYTAESASDGSWVLYDERFMPCFPRAWDSCTAAPGELTVSTTGGKYTYTVNSNGFSLKKASVSGTVLGCDYTMDISSRILLSKLSIPMLERMTSDTGKYIEYAFGGSDELLSDITTGSHYAFRQLFQDDHKIISRQLKGINEIFVYSVRADDEISHYAVSITADAEIVYSDEKTGTNHLYGRYKAIAEFTGSSENDLTAISASFTQKAPDYPEPEPEIPTENLNPETQAEPQAESA